MRVNAVQTSALGLQTPTVRRYVPAPGGIRNQQCGQGLAVRQTATPLVRAVPTPQLIRPVEARPRRATLATASPDIVHRPIQVRAPEPDFVEFSTPGTRMPAPLPSIWRGRYEVCQDMPVLGGGAFAEVFKVRERRSMQCFAVKVMHRPNFALRGIEQQIDSEISAMRLAAEKAARTEIVEEGHIVALLDVAEENEYIFLLLELCEQGDLLRKLAAEPTQRFSEATAAVWAKQLLLGLRNLHSLGFIHRDIKPDNLLCTEGNVLKLADFGWCCETQEAPSCLAGTFQYMAPEVLRNVPQTEAVDVWSAGVTLHQLLLGKPLLNTYLGPGATQLSECDPHAACAIKQGRLLDEMHATCPPTHDRRPPELSPMCWDFLRQLLMPDVHLRITVDAALEHAWLAQTITSVGPVRRPIKLREPEPIRQPQLSPSPKREDAATHLVDVSGVPDSTDCGDPEMTGPCEAHERRFSEDMPLSPAHKKSDPRSPSTGGKSNSSIDNVPTPLQPRTWDPTRNMAYTPPMEKSDDQPAPEGTPEVSPERKSKLLMSADRVAKFNMSPKDTLLHQPTPARSPLSRLSPAAASRTVYPYRRRTIASGTSCPADSPADELGTSRRIDPKAATVLLNTLHSCNEQLRQIHSVMVERTASKDEGASLLRSTGAILESSFEHSLDFTTPASGMRVLQDPEAAAMVVDVLTKTAPPTLGVSTPGFSAPFHKIDGSLRGAKAKDALARMSPERRFSVENRENVPSVNVSTMYPSRAVVWNDTKMPGTSPRLQPGRTPAVWHPAAGSPQKIQHAPGQHHFAPTSRIALAAPQQRVWVATSQQWAPAATVCSTTQGNPGGWAQQAANGPTVRPLGMTRRRQSAPSAWLTRCG